MLKHFLPNTLNHPFAIAENVVCFGDLLNKKTPPKINMEPKNHPIEKENHLPNLHSWLPRWFSRVYYTGLYTVGGWANQIGLSASCESSRFLRESNSRDLQGKNFDGWKQMRHKHIPSLRFGWQFNHKSHGRKVNWTTLSKSTGCTSWSPIFVIIFNKKTGAAFRRST